MSYFLSLPFSPSTARSALSFRPAVAGCCIKFGDGADGPAWFPSVGSVRTGTNLPPHPDLLGLEGAN